MSNEREFDRSRARDNAHIDHDDLTPNRGTKSSQLDAPAHPIAGGLLQRKARDANGVAEGADQAVAAASSSSGASLPEPLMRKFEASLGTDLSSVRVHTGGESAEAASAVGAKAYTMGQDIHFGAGHFDPSSEAGEHLLAHEVAHTVQQAGGATSGRQNKLEVSAPGDHLEHEADRAATAMITGTPIALSYGGSVQRKIFRDTEKEPAAASNDKEWATGARAKISELQDAVTAAMRRLNADASGAATSLHAAKATCQSYEREFEKARSTFTSHVKKAIEQQKEFEEMVKSNLEAALAVYSLGGTELAELFVETEHVMKIVDSISTKVGVISGPAKEAPKRLGGDVKTAGSGIDWEQHLETALHTLTSYIQQNKSLAAMNQACIEGTRLLTQVIEGHAPKNAKQSSAGTKADQLAHGAEHAHEQLNEMGTELAVHAAGFANGLKTDLTARGMGNPKKIEQDIAIKWLGSQSTNANGTTNSGMFGRGSAEIHAARDYLEQLGVLGKTSRLGINVGGWDTDVDDDNIVARARVESAAMKLVGATADWQGGKINGNIATGHIAAGAEVWKASGAASKDDPSMRTPTVGLKESAGGAVRITSYAIAPITQMISDAPGAMKPQLLHDLVTLNVVALGTGAVAQFHGPSVGPAPEGEGE